MNYNFYSKILIISAHPDDLEISCAGTVKKFIKAGTVVDNLIMIPNVPHLKYLDSSAFGLGFNYIVFDNDIDRPNIVDNKLIQEVEEKYSLFGYDLIISHWKEDWHQDHRMCYHLTNSLRRKQPIDVWYMDAFPYNQKYNQFKSHPKFIPYLEKMTTLYFYSKANIGSRPSKRANTKKLNFNDLRAIPFVGSWSQSKQNVPGFFGVGSALKSFEKKK